MSLTSKVEIIPAVIPQSLDDLKSKLVRLRGCGARTVQIDVTDGMFVFNRSWPMNPGDASSFTRIVSGDEGLPFWEEFDFEIDVMAHNPEKLLPDWVRAGASRAVIHAKSRHDFARCRDIVGDALELGIALDLDPPYERVSQYFSQVDYVQIMGIAKLGQQGEPFDERVFDVIARVLKDVPDMIIQIDGGVDDEVAGDLIEAGVSRLVSGSFVLGAYSPKEAVRKLSKGTLVD